MFACAKSRAELLRMIAEYQGGSLSPGMNAARIAKYWSEGAWGNPMEGVEPEPGLWIQYRNDTTPERVWPKEKSNA